MSTVATSVIAEKEEKTDMTREELLISFATAFQKYLLREFEAKLPEVHRTVLKGITPEVFCQQIADLKREYNISDEESFEHQSEDFHTKLLQYLPQISLTNAQQKRIKQYVKCLIKYSD